MPFGNVFEKINSEYYQLTSAEKKVADYVVIHQQKTQFMSISELSEECGVAEATISRFCRRLGLEGKLISVPRRITSDWASPPEKKTFGLAGVIFSANTAVRRQME